MAERNVFVSKKEYPFFEEIHVEFDWFGGFALSQKRKCEIGLHNNFLLEYPNQKVLEVSSSSLSKLGTQLSAMKLMKRTLKGVTTAESAFQSSKIYMDGGRQVGPFPEYLFLEGRECKKIVKEKSKGFRLYKYEFDGMSFSVPEFHRSLFYDYIYLNSLLEEENTIVKERLLDRGYTAFTDLATKSLNSQARSCAIFVGLVSAGLIDEVKEYDSYLKLFRVNKEGVAVGPESYENIQLLLPVVSCRFNKKDVDNYYKIQYSHLTNKKGDSDNYLP